MEPLTSEDRSKLTRTARRLASGSTWDAIAVVLGFQVESLRAFVDAHRAEFTRLLTRAYRETVTEALFEGIAVMRGRLNDPDPAESRRAAECLIRVGLAFRRERANRLKVRPTRETWPTDNPLEPLPPLDTFRDPEPQRRQPHAVPDRSRPTPPTPAPPAPPAPKVDAKPAPRPQPRVPFANEKIEAFMGQGLGNAGAHPKKRIDPAVAANWGISVEALERIATGEKDSGK